MKKSKLLTLIMCMVCTVLFGAWFVQNDYHLTLGDQSQSKAKTIKKIVAAWEVNDGAAFESQATTHFKFKVSEHSYQKPISKSLKDHCIAIAKHIQDTPNKSLVITGFYGAYEANNSSFPNVGLARAHEIQMLMNGFGLDLQKINLRSQQISEAYFLNATLIKGIDFGIAELDQEETTSLALVTKGDLASTQAIAPSNNKLEAIEQRLLNQAMLLYFGTYESYLKLSDQQEQDILDMKYYLEHVQGSFLQINGHTDSKGKDDVNQKLSEERAQYVKNIFVRDFDFVINKLITSGFGESQPITKNRTSEERAKNRRVEIILTKN